MFFSKKLTKDIPEFAPIEKKKKPVAKKKKPIKKEEPKPVENIQPQPMTIEDIPYYENNIDSFNLNDSLSKREAIFVHMVQALISRGDSMYNGYSLLNEADDYTEKVINYLNDFN